MKNVLKFIIQAIRTLDGRRGTAQKMLNLMNHQSFEEYKSSKGAFVVPEAEKLNLI